MNRKGVTGLLMALVFLSFVIFGASWKPITLLDSLLFNQLSQVLNSGETTPIYGFVNPELSHSENVLNSDVEFGWYERLIDTLYFGGSASPNQIYLFEHKNDYLTKTSFLNSIEYLTGQNAKLISQNQILSGYISVNTGFSGDVWIPKFDLPPVTLIPVDTNNFSDKLVVFGSDRAFVENHKNLIWAINQDLTFYSPSWQPVFEIVLGCLVLAMMGLAVNRSSSVLIWTIMVLVPGGVVVTNLLLMVLSRIWLPEADVIVATWVASLICLKLASVNRNIHRITQDFLADRETLYRIQIDKQLYDETYAHLQKRGFHKNLSRVTYELGLGFERKRAFEKAAKVYTMLSKTGHFEDSKERLARIGKMSQQSTISDIKSTLIMDKDSLQLPELGRYQIIEELGRGSMGVVYRAKDPKIDRELAIKTVTFSDLSSDEVDSVKRRFFREAQAAGKLNHPNIVTVFDVGEERDIAYIAMDYVKGQPLSELTDENNLLDYQQVFEAFSKVARALSFAHSHDIIHRDIKPSNLLYDKDTKEIKVSDFGIARISDNRQTQTGIVLGSPSYMSPEQIRGELLTGQSDIFSLGVSLYQVLTGHLPFAGETLPALAYAITHHKHRNVRDYRPELPVAATRIVNKALQKEPEKRFTDAGQMAKALTNAFLKEET